MESSAEFLPISDGSPPVEYDIDAELMELPYVLRININNPIIEIPYLRVKAREYIERGRLKAGIAWKSGDWDARRSIPYEKMKLLNKVEGVDFHILQKGKGLSEWTDNFGFLSGSEDIYEAAEIVKSLDVVITADTMIAHLAGALGVRVWLLLCDDPDWRWFENRSDSPWYPTMRIFRQKKAGEWDKVIAEVAQELSIMQKKASKFC
ncbi:MAG: hypothetical protein BWY69_00258 [Planctomycetes bacterium ADurb.Bin401]|nr:MAG: hypothetical protein BWY69_00258 [Planctomycetes bacterium ADurb.Bin401]